MSKPPKTPPTGTETPEKPATKTRRRTRLPGGPLWSKLVDSSAPAFVPPETPPPPATASESPAPDLTPPEIPMNDDDSDKPKDKTTIITTTVQAPASPAPSERVRASLMDGLLGPKESETAVYFHPVDAVSGKRMIHALKITEDEPPESAAVRIAGLKPGTYHVIEKTSAGFGSPRIHVVDPEPSGAAAVTAAPPPYAAPVPAPRADDGMDFKREFFDLLKVVVGRPPQQAAPMDWAGVLGAGATVVGAVGALVTPLVMKRMDLSATPVVKDPMTALREALEMGKQVTTVLGGQLGVGGKTNSYDLIMHAITEGKEMVGHLKDIAKIDAAATAPVERPPPAAPAAATAQPAPVPPSPSPAPAAVVEPPAPVYEATMAGLMAFMATHLDALVEGCDEGRSAKLGAAMVAMEFDDGAHAQLLPVAHQALAMPSLVALLGQHDARVKDRAAWFETLRVTLLAVLPEAEGQGA